MEHYESDVVVLGSGGAGLVASCGAADSGLRTTVLERSPVFGGTTAVSGGMLWIPNNHLMLEAGMEDSIEDARTYVRRVAGGVVDDERIEAFLELAPELIRYLEKKTPVSLQPIDRPDYHSEWEGARLGGRTLDNLPFDISGYEGLSLKAREGSHFPPLTYQERHEWRSPERFDWDLIAGRMTGGVRTLGAALVAALVVAADQRGVEMKANVRGRELIVENGRAIGLRAETDAGWAEFIGRVGVVVACGGFEWNESMKATFLRGPERNPVSPPWNEGDGLVMAMHAGAALTNMTEAWWVPTFNVPGEEYDGRPMARHVIDELALPGSILVNRAGRRFVNEATNYNDLSRAFHVIDPESCELANVPAWLVFDHRFKATYSVGTVMASEDAPEWFKRGGSLEELAEDAGIDPPGLRATAERFNAQAGSGKDEDFGRGEARHDSYYGDESHGPNACLAPLHEPPFYAIQIVPGSLGTKGGIRTDVSGRVVGMGGEPIPGLFACGNVAGSTMGIGYPGAGGTLGPALTDAFACGRSLGIGSG